MSEEIPEDVQRWTSKRRAALVLSILKGETSVQEAARVILRGRASNPLRLLVDQFTGLPLRSCARRSANCCPQ